MSGLNNVDSELKNKAKQEGIRNSFYSSIPVIVQGYTGIKTVPFPGGFTIYNLSIVVTWYPTSQAIIDSNLILKLGLDIDRAFGIEFINSFYRLSYENAYGIKQYGSYRPLDSSVIGMKLTGAITVPYIYFA